MEESAYAEVRPPDKSKGRLKEKDSDREKEKRKRKKDDEKRRSKSPDDEHGRDKRDRKGRDATEMIENDKDERRRRKKEKNGEIPRSKRNGHGTTQQMWTEIPDGKVGRKQSKRDKNGNVPKSQEEDKRVEQNGSRKLPADIGDNPYAEVKERTPRGDSLPKEKKSSRRKRDQSSSERKTSKDRDSKKKVKSGEIKLTKAEVKAETNSKPKSSKERGRGAELVLEEAPYAEVNEKSRWERSKDRTSSKSKSSTKWKSSRESIPTTDNVQNTLEGPDATGTRKKSTSVKKVQRRDLPSVPNASSVNESQGIPGHEMAYATVAPKNKRVTPIQNISPMPLGDGTHDQQGPSEVVDAPYATVPPKGQRKSGIEQFSNIEFIDLEKKSLKKKSSKKSGAVDPNQETPYAVVAPKSKRQSRIPAKRALSPNVSDLKTEKAGLTFDRRSPESHGSNETTNFTVATVHRVQPREGADLPTSGNNRISADDNDPSAQYAVVQPKSKRKSDGGEPDAHGGETRRVLSVDSQDVPYAVVVPKSERKAHQPVSNGNASTADPDGKLPDSEDHSASYEIVPMSSQRTSKLGKSKARVKPAGPRNESMTSTGNSPEVTELENPDVPYAVVTPKHQRGSTNETSRGRGTPTIQAKEQSPERSSSIAPSPKGEGNIQEQMTYSYDAPYAVVAPRPTRKSEREEWDVMEPITDAEDMIRDSPKSAPVDLSEAPYATVPPKGERKASRSSLAITAPKSSSNSISANSGIGRAHSQRREGHGQERQLLSPDYNRSSSLPDHRIDIPTSPILSREPSFSSKSPILSRGPSFTGKESRSSRRSSASPDSAPEDKGDLRRNSLYLMIPEEDDKPLPILFKEELQPAGLLPTVDEDPPSYDMVSDGTSKDTELGNGNLAFHPEADDVTAISNFKDEGYRELVDKRSRDRARKRSKRRIICIVVVLMIFLSLVIVVGGAIVAVKLCIIDRMICNVDST